MSLKFSEKAHRYTLDGKSVPGVTTLLGKGLPKPAIPYWAAKMVAEYVIGNPDGVEHLRTMGDGPAIAALKQIPWEKRDQAAIRGTDIHALAERLIHGEKVEVPEHLHDHVEGYARFLDAFRIEALHTEIAVASRKWQYAGKLDAIIRIGHGPWAGRTALADWKTSKGVYGETALQTAAYARAEFMAPDADTEIEMPQVDCTGVVHLTAEGCEFYPLAQTPAEIDEQFKLFCHIAHVAKKVDWIKGLVGESMDEPEAEEAS